jgi:hypothetical protein
MDTNKEITNCWNYDASFTFPLILISKYYYFKYPIFSTECIIPVVKD